MDLSTLQVDGQSLSTIVQQTKSRNVPNLSEPLSNATVTIAGAGGLGSNIAIALTRAGIGHLRLIDFDVVDPSNLNRQQYRFSQIGMKKVVALSQNLLEINPFLDVSSMDLKVTKDNVLSLFDGSDIIVEAFDNPEGKALLLNQLAVSMPTIPLVMGSGMAGIHSSNSIQSRKLSENVYLCGDGTSKGMEGLMAPRVMICAGHQANIVIRLLSGQTGI